MKNFIKAFVATSCLFYGVNANAISLCDNGSTEECSVLIYQEFIKNFAKVQAENSKVPAEQFARNLESVVSADDFLPIYQQCEKDGEDMIETVRCCKEGFEKAFFTPSEDPKGLEFINKTLPEIVATWDVDTFLKSATPEFNKENYSSVAQFAKQTFGDCTVSSVNVVDRNIEINKGFVYNTYRAHLACQKGDMLMDIVLFPKGNSFVYYHMDIGSASEENG